MRLASYNLENLFDRPKAMNSDLWTAGGGEGDFADRIADGRAILNLYSSVNALLRKHVYTAEDKQDIVRGLISLGLEHSDDSRFVRLRQNRGRLLRRPSQGGLQIVANGRGDWVGWIELEREPVDEKATRNTARVIKDVNADILAVIEVEDRIPLLRFNEDVLPSAGGPTTYDHVMVINGNDDRGIDVGIMTRGYPLEAICSHVDDRGTDGERVFSRDCIRFRVQTSRGPLWILVNHLKSKGYGDFQQSERRRRAQATRVREIYDDLIERGETLVAVVGDFNDTPDSDALLPLRGGGGPRDVTEHASYEPSDGRVGTYGNCAASDHIDFILLSPTLFALVEKAGIHRRGIWGGRNGTLFEHYDTIEGPHEAASDHAAVWVDLDLTAVESEADSDASGLDAVHRGGRSDRSGCRACGQGRGGPGRRRGRRCRRSPHVPAPYRWRRRRDGRRSDRKGPGRAPVPAPDPGPGTGGRRGTSQPARTA